MRSWEPAGVSSVVLFQLSRTVGRFLVSLSPCLMVCQQEHKISVNSSLTFLLSLNTRLLTTPTNKAHNILLLLLLLRSGPKLCYMLCCVLLLFILKSVFLPHLVTAEIFCFKILLMKTPCHLSLSPLIGILQWRENWKYFLNELGSWLGMKIFF